jgi:hypothetical protein
MPKTFYTDHDIQDLANRGATSLEVNDDVVLTDLAREQAFKRGIQLVSAKEPRSVTSSANDAELVQRVKAAVIERLGNEVDHKLLEAVITRVLSHL